MQIGTIPSAAPAIRRHQPANALIDLVYALGAQYRANGTFIMNSKTAAAVRKMRDTDGRFLWGGQSLAMGQPSATAGLSGAAVRGHADIAAGSASIAFGDFRSAYTIVERPTCGAARSLSAKPHVLFYATKRVGGGVTDARAIKLMVFG